MAAAEAAAKLQALVEERAQRKAARAAKTVQVVAEFQQRLAAARTSDATISRWVLDRGEKAGGVRLARAAISLLEADPRFPGVGLVEHREAMRGLLFSKLGDALNTVRKGAWGRQVGKAHLPNIVRELFGEQTGDKAASVFARGYEAANQAAIDHYNRAGGWAKASEHYHLPQIQSAAKLAQAGERQWIDDIGTALDWEAMRWPQTGLPIAERDRPAALREAYRTLSTSGASKAELGTRQQHIALQEERFLVFKDAESWLRIHAAYGDGNPFDVIVRHLDTMAHRIALVQTFGEHPHTMRDTMVNAVRKAAADVAPEAVVEAEGALRSTFEPMFSVAVYDNPMDPDSLLGNTVVGLSNLMVAAKLGSATLLAIPGDFVATLATRVFNRMDAFGGLGTYLDALLTNQQEARAIATQSGYVVDDVILSIYGAERFTGFNTVGPYATRLLSDAVTRVSLLTPHTNAARWAVRSELMGAMARSRDRVLADLDFGLVLMRYGITAADWDAFRTAVPTWSPAKGVALLRPLEILDTDLPNKDELFRKFSAFVIGESKRMVFGSNLEGLTRLKGTTRPDTLHGAILHSFSLFKNFPISLFLSYGRLALTEPETRSRLKFIGGLGVGMTAVGALATQLYEIAKGREPLPMDTPEFWGKALLKGGALGLWGDFLWGGVNQYGQGPEQVIGGPLATWAADTTQLAFGDIFKFAEAIGGLSDYELNMPAKAVEYARRYTPGANIWFARLALERVVFDRLSLLADPGAYTEHRRREARRAKRYGNPSWWPPMASVH